MSENHQHRPRKKFEPHEWRGMRDYRRHRWGPRRYRPDWHKKRRTLFFRFVGFIAAALLFFLLGMAGLAFLATRLFGGDGQATLLVWMVSCGIALAFPILAVVIAMRSFRRVVNPLAQVMAAADEVAEGDFSVRVAEVGSGEFGRLARSFNRMVEELERADQQRRDLTADVAHELRTPIHIMQGNLEGIVDGVYEPSPEQIELLISETSQLSRLVEDLRTLSLAEAGQLRLEQEQISVGELLADAATSFSGQAEAAGVKITLDVVMDAEPLRVLGDAGRLDQVVSNLVANALGHTPAGGQIKLRAWGEQEIVFIQVSDNGSGIAADDLPHIFDRFWRGENARQSSSGLGLAIAKQLVQAHGGEIKVESQLNEGTTFRVELPQEMNE